MLVNPLKLVIWDLDDTFWNGTLTEGPVTVPPENVRILKTLAQRGIVSSISSKNDFQSAKRRLEQDDLWAYFVFARIEFAPKGSAIPDLIESMNLRPDNVLFVDDSPHNLEQAKFFSPNLMTARPEEILPTILDLPQAAGKEDLGLARLKQYKQLEQKALERSTTHGSNEDFLRASNIIIRIEQDVESNLGRVVELLNRSNQLNFTKKRLESEASVSDFRKRLRTYGYHAGVVTARDKYGDYGLVGFYMTVRFAYGYWAEHFVFSCRIMNMGIEQYVYEMLGKPRLCIVQPVTNCLREFERIDWINAGGSPQDVQPREARDEALLLIGGCDLLQVSTYCSLNRAEFVNHDRRGNMIRYDDPGFILSSRDRITRSETLPKVPCWTADDALRFDEALARARVVIVSLWEAMDGDYLLIDDGILVRIDSRYLGKNLARSIDSSHVGEVRLLRIGDDTKLKLVELALDEIARRSDASHRFVLGVNTRRCSAPGLEPRRRYNGFVRRYCALRSDYRFICIDETVAESDLLDADAQHFTRSGYFSLASRITALAAEQPAIGAPGGSRVQGSSRPFTDLLKGATELALEAYGAKS